MAQRDVTALPLTYWYAYCAACDWTGPQRKTCDEAETDKSGHVCGRIADPRCYVIEGKLEEIE